MAKTSKWASELYGILLVENARVTTESEQRESDPLVSVALEIFEDGEWQLVASESARTLDDAMAAVVDEYFLWVEGEPG